MSCSVLDEEQFRLSCQLLLQRSDQLGDGWSWEAVQGSEEGYLRKTALRSVPSDWGPLHDQKGFSSHPQPQTLCDSTGHEKEEDPAASTGSDFLRAEEEDDGSYTVTNSSSLVLQYEYHILFSCSYGAPVLYFRAFTLEGRSLALEEMWSTIHPNYRLCFQNCPLNAISQQEHPLLGQPFFFFHPCRTEEFMGPVLQAAPDQGRPVNYVLSWLSVVGPVVGLDVPLQYCTALHSTKPD
ncbi:ubiquitin-like-conjugating enzyme ATG10 isoform X2 [Xiphophorus couchianus]|uniref:ubiquitin-like-conjugating enzyme ATG10 isoform X2 n=1 Tax=Xiphophorus couchianus TaxID=32473 RepID=UPI001016D8F7|nr:ubiquitin-like-conjugating enzyme ATG10 isoform X2 [Xiphophorus couchianus]